MLCKLLILKIKKLYCVFMNFTLTTLHALKKVHFYAL
nr:MAG TPA: hypothetical protein [Caudoviricetes sp.]